MSEVDRLLAEAEATDRQFEQEQRAQERRLLERIAKNTSPKLTRSRMSVREKNAFINRHGMDRSLRLPWAAD
jgi:hypothetical protein